MGVLLYILLCGYPPFYAETNPDLYRLIVAGVYEFHATEWAGISEGAKDLVSKMLVVDPSKRLTMAQVLAHTWMTSTVTPTVHLATTLDNLKKFNARRKIKAAAAAVRLGAMRGVGLRQDILKELTDSGKASFPLAELEALNAEFLKIAGTGGSISREKFGEVMTRLGHADLPLDRLFQVLDEDGSGDVDYKELLAALARLRSDDVEAIRMCFKIFDVDGSGSLSMQELVDMLRLTAAEEDAAVASGAESPYAGTAAAAAATGGAAATAAASSASAATTASADARNAALEGLFARMDSNHDGRSE